MGDRWSMMVGVLVGVWMPSLWHSELWGRFFGERNEGE